MVFLMVNIIFILRFVDISLISKLLSFEKKNVPSDENVWQWKEVFRKGTSLQVSVIKCYWKA